MNFLLVSSEGGGLGEDAETERTVEEPAAGTRAQVHWDWDPRLSPIDIDMLARDLGLGLGTLTSTMTLLVRLELVERNVLDADLALTRNPGNIINYEISL